MEQYPEIATERFDDANFHINYCFGKCIVAVYKKIKLF
tara:strand:- start:289 stop:402 length:114 start_codon:yes stop_codon:yes gene_type:complete